MSSDRARALLVHASPGRARLRIEGPNANAALVSSLADRLAQHAAVRDVRASARTGSLLILHEGELQPILEFAGELGLFELVPKPPHASMRALRARIERADERMAAETGDALGLGKLAFFVLAGAGVWQAANGRLLPAGMTLFNYALEVMDWVANRESTISPHRS